MLNFLEGNQPVSRIYVDGKFFRLNERKWFVKGFTYGPFAPDAAGEQHLGCARIWRGCDRWGPATGRSFWASLASTRFATGRRGRRACSPIM
jgi:hypothetical protein